MSLTRKIPTSRLRPGMHLHKLGGSWLDHPFLRNSFLLNDYADIRKIQDAGIAFVWIDESKGEALSDADESDYETLEIEDDDDSDVSEQEVSTSETPVISQVAPAPDQPAATKVDIIGEIERARMICYTGKEQVKAMFNDLRMGNSLSQDAVIPLIEEISASIWRNPSALISVARLKTHDDYTYMHSVAVAALMIALAKQLGLDAEKTRIAGIGGLMHDLGKAFMPLEVLNKPGRLTDTEFAIMKTHPAKGARVLQEVGADARVIDIALHHHEKINGSGYPHGLKDEEISLLAKMGAVCDVYDAVTSVRAYKNPWDPALAMREMARWAGHFDKQIFNAFVKSVGIYPVGSLVKLSSDRLAIIAEPNESHLLKPRVRVFYSIRSREKIMMHTLDLADPACTETIVGPENPVTWGFTNLEALWL
jgi:putative nucleotidyltransferase with HDIG domain